jgi:transposase
MTRGYARCKKGQRAIGKVPRNRGSNLSLIAALSAQTIGAEMVLDGAVDGDAFEAWVEQVLLPWLQPDQVVVWDNVTPHHRPAVQTLVESVGCSVIFLPAYSPDFNPIEQAFSKIKAFLKATAARTRDTLQNAIAQAIATISGHDIFGWFHHCGYPLPEPL